ncbi:MAG TPA: DUF2470 domain-containing protein [Burkholderiales bacterium]|nr:DUF2470 domain-containing protein [Burkholderiales bacterium]
MTRGANARRLVRRFAAGVLATQSARHPGYPYASSLPLCTDPRGRPVLLVSHLAEHTRNAEADGRVGLLVSPLDAGLQEQARVSMVGDAAPLDVQGADAAAAARYLRRFPEAHRYLEIGGFHFLRIEPVSLRYIAGFGSIHTLAADGYLAPESALAAAEEDIVAHMNADHAAALAGYCRHVHGVNADSAVMTGIDCDGFDVRAGGALLRFDFEGEITDAAQARAELVRLARASRS